MIKKLLILFFTFFFFGIYQAKATHLRAADIVAERIGQTKFKFTLTVFRDTEGADIIDNEVLRILNSTAGINDDIIINPISSSETNIGNKTEKYVFEYEYTFPAAGVVYTVYYQQQNRNNNIVNLKSPSQTIPFYVQTTFYINPLETTFNQTPVLTVPPYRPWGSRRCFCS